jgi:hypothetical protein
MTNTAAFNNLRLLQLISMFQPQMMSVSVRNKLLYEALRLMLGICKISDGFRNSKNLICFYIGVKLALSP